MSFGWDIPKAGKLIYHDGVLQSRERQKAGSGVGGDAASPALCQGCLSHQGAATEEPRPAPHSGRHWFLREETRRAGGPQGRVRRKAQRQPTGSQEG